MGQEDAKITVGADASEVEKAFAKSRDAVRGATAELASSVGSAAHSAVSSLMSVATAASQVNFHAQRDSVKEFEASTARFAVSAGKDLETVRKSFESTG